jgi:peptide/nickel transport system ATP-binding protein
MSENILEVTNLEVKYYTDEEVVSAVNGISFSIKKGKTLGLVGETGAGKTTTALSILRLLPKGTAKIIQGKIIFDGIDLTLAPEAAMQKIRGGEISMIFQDPMTALNPTLTIEQQIGEMIQLHSRKNKKEIEERVIELLQLVGIVPSRRKEYPHQFSGGMKQRVVIAMALACEPKLIIADEPTTALDVTIQAQVLKMMSELKSVFDTSMILITHDFGIVVKMCDEIGVMYAGEILEYGSVYEIFDKSLPHHPYTKGLLGSIPKLTEKTDRLQQILGTLPNPTELPIGCNFASRCEYCMPECKLKQPRTYQMKGHQILCNLYTAGE